MAEPVKATIGFVSGGVSSMPHYNSFLPLIPGEIKMDFQGMDLSRESLYQIEGKKQIIIQKVQEFVTQRSWNGVIVTAAPTEVLNPGLFADLQAALNALARAAASSFTSAANLAAALNELEALTRSFSRT